ncbi:MAG: AAA family ATPase, partial [Candidatus Nanopelagicales bacterium]
MTEHGTMTEDEAARFAANGQMIIDNVAGFIQGKRDVITLAVTCLLAEGHLLLEDVPGVGKTSLARSIAATLGMSWHRIQFTPDLLPSDVTGVSIFHQGAGTFEFHPGPVFAHVVLADEINRASPRTQSALLEVMEERTVTVDGVTHQVPQPFLVLATQNPIEMDGTFPLPEAQLDRFLMSVSIGYPDLASEVQVLANNHAG